MSQQTMNEIANRQPLRINSEWLGRISYSDGFALQQRRINEVRAGERSTILWLEHSPVITVGRAGHEEHILAGTDELKAAGVQLVSVDRGGDVTFHGPGQLVVYPIFDLDPWNQDIRRYVWNLEEVVIRTLASYGLSAHRLQGHPGVWLGSAKICALGAKANRHLNRRGYVMSHGFALNVDVDLSYFSFIVPCGLHDKSVTSMERELAAVPSLHELIYKLSESFQEVFGIQLDTLSND